MNNDEERRLAVAAIDAQIATLIEDGVAPDSSRIRALKAKRAVAQKSKKAIKRTVRKARERDAAAASAGGSGTGTKTASAKAAGRVALVPDSTADIRRLQSLPARERTRIETARIAVRQVLTWCDEPSSEGVRDAIASCDSDISALIDKGVRYEADARTQLRNRRTQLKELAGAFASRDDGSLRRRSSNWPSCWTPIWNGAARSAGGRRTSSACSMCGPGEHPP